MAGISGRFDAIQWEWEYTEEGPRLAIIHSIRMVIVSRARTPRNNDSYIIHYILNMHVQDCVCVIVTFPNNPNPAEDFDPTRDMDISGQGLQFYARPQLFFYFTVCPKGRAAKKHSHIELSLVTQQKILTPHKIMSGQGLRWYARPQLFFHCSVPRRTRGQKHCHIECSLVFFSTFEPINITPHSVMQSNGVPVLYDSASSSNEPSLYICPVSKVLGSVPSIPVLLQAMSTRLFCMAFAVVRGQ